MIWVFSSIVVLFFIFLILKQFLKLEFCVLCLSVFSSWVLFLILFWLGWFKNLILIAVLIGGSLVGFYYGIEKRARREWLIFRLPFYLSLVFLSFLILGQFEYWRETLSLLLGLWLVFGLLFFSSQNDKFKRIIQRLIECCKNW